MSKIQNALNASDYLFPVMLTTEKVEQLKNELKKIDCKKSNCTELVAEIKSFIDSNPSSSAENVEKCVIEFFDKVFDATGLYPNVERISTYSNAFYISLNDNRRVLDTFNYEYEFPKNTKILFSSYLFDNIDAGFPAIKITSNKHFLIMMLCACMMALYAANN